MQPEQFGFRVGYAVGARLRADDRELLLGEHFRTGCTPHGRSPNARAPTNTAATNPNSLARINVTKIRKHGTGSSTNYEQIQTGRSAPEEQHESAELRGRASVLYHFDLCVQPGLLTMTDGKIPQFDCHEWNTKSSRPGGTSSTGKTAGFSPPTLSGGSASVKRPGCQLSVCLARLALA